MNPHDPGANIAKGIYTVDKLRHTFDCKSCKYSAADNVPCAPYCKYSGLTQEIPERELKFLNVTQLLHNRFELKPGLFFDFHIHDDLADTAVFALIDRKLKLNNS